MTEVFRCLDCRLREVVLTGYVWHEHILYDHNHLDGLDWCIHDAIQQPDVIRKDSVRANRECYYRAGVLPGSYALYLKVVVEFEKHGGLWLGTVVTAYEADHLKPKEKQVWP